MLRERSFESVVYLTFLQEKTQKEALEYIYNKDYSSINIRPFKEARQNLASEEMIGSDGSLRNAAFTSKVEPIVEEISKELQLAKNEEKALKKILDSEFFRECFSRENLEKLPFLARDEKGRLDIQLGSEGAFEVAYQVLYDLMAFSSQSEGALQVKADQIDLVSVNQYEDFSTYIQSKEKWLLSVEPQEFIDLNREDIEKGSRNPEWCIHVLEKVSVRHKLLYRLPGYHLESDKTLFSIPHIGHQESNLWQNIDIE